MNFLARALQRGDQSVLGAYKTIQLKIVNWYETESERILLQSKSDDCEMNEKVRIYHHSLHSKNIKKGCINKLQTERGLLNGHSECSSYLEDKVKTLLLNPHNFDPNSRNTLLS